MRKIILVLLVIALRFEPAYAMPVSDSSVTSEAKQLFWLTVGGGAIGPGVGGNIKATYAWGKHESISAKVCGAGEFSIFGPSHNEVVEYGLYYGALEYNDWGLIRLAIGPSYFTGERHYGNFIHDFGIGAEAEAMLKYEYVGLSLMATMMYTPKFFFVGMVLNLSIGKLN